MKTYTIEFTTKRGARAITYVTAETEQAAQDKARRTYKEEMAEEALLRTTSVYEVPEQVQRLEYWGQKE